MKNINNSYREFIKADLLLGTIGGVVVFVVLGIFLIWHFFLEEYRIFLLYLLMHELFPDFLVDFFVGFGKLFFDIVYRLADILGIDIYMSGPPIR